MYSILVFFSLIKFAKFRCPPYCGSDNARSCHASKPMVTDMWAWRGGEEPTPKTRSSFIMAAACCPETKPEKSGKWHQLVAIQWCHPLEEERASPARAFQAAPIHCRKSSRVPVHNGSINVGSALWYYHYQSYSSCRSRFFPPVHSEALTAPFAFLAPPKEMDHTDTAAEPLAGRISIYLRLTSCVEVSIISNGSFPTFKLVWHLGSPWVVVASSLEI